MRKIILFAAAALALCSCTKELSDNVPVTGGDVPAAEDNDVFPGWVRVKLSDDAQPLKVGVFTRGAANSGDADLDKLAADLGATEIRRVFTPNKRFEKRHRAHGLHLWFDIKFDESVPVSRARGQFEALPQIAVVEPVYRVEPTDGPDYIMPARDGFTVGAMAKAKASASTRTDAMPFDDPELYKQWHYNNDGSIANSIAGADINLFKAWEKFGAGDPSVIVCVVDNAVQADHPDLAANMWVNTGEIPGNGIDDDGNGFIDDVNGWDFYMKAPISDLGDHGTHVAGTVAAVNNNGIGVCGVAGGTGNGDGARIMSAVIYDASGYAGEGYGANTNPDTYVYSADNGAVISQNSWNIAGNNIPTETPKSLADAFDYFIKYAGVDENDNQVGPMRGGIIFFAAGNDFSDYVGTPSNYPGVVCVSAMMPNFVKASYSNYGTAVDIFAPGGKGSGDNEFTDTGRIYSTDIGGGYRYMSGTSMACPHVSGIAALIVSKFGGQGFTNEKLKQMIFSSVKNVTQYQKTPDIAAGLGAGLIDAAMVDNQNPDAAPDKPTNVTVTSNAKVEKELILSMTVTADASGKYIAGFNISYVKESDKNDQSKWIKDIKLTNNFNIGDTKSTKINNLEDATDYIFRVNAYDRFGNESEYVEVKGRTIDHINRSPVHTAIITQVSFPIINGNSKSFETTLDLSTYFSDPDLPNDELTYSAESRDNAIVSASVDGNILTVKGLKKGNASIVVYCTDRGGLKINKSFAVKVLEDVSGSVGIIKAFEPVNFPMTQNGVQVYETSFELKDYFSGTESDVTYSVSSGASSVASAELKNGNTMMIKGISNGNTVVTVKATSQSGANVSQTVAVSVAGKTVAVGNKLSVYPNPVVDVAKVSISGAGNANAQMRIYDSASRVVKRGDISFAGDVMQAYDLTSLAPGVYTMVVSVAGTEYKNTFVKK